MEPQSSNTSNENLQANFPRSSIESSNPGNEIAGAQVIEAGPAPQETDMARREAINQNSGMALPKVVTPVADDNQINPVTQAQVAPVTTVDPANPVTADDVDVVEKEWVDRARQIVEQTKNDPYRQEEEVEKLQIDYMKKRYGRDIKAGSDS